MTSPIQQLPPPIDFVWSSILRKVEAIAARRLVSPVSGAVRAELLSYLVSELPRARYYSFRDAVDFTNEWGRLRGVEDANKEPVVADFVIDCCVEFDLFLRMSKFDFDELCAEIANSMTQFKNSNTVIDPEFQRRLPSDATTLAELYQSNSWLVFMILLQQTQLVEKIAAQAR